MMSVLSVSLFENGMSNCSLTNPHRGLSQSVSNKHKFSI